MIMAQLTYQLPSDLPVAPPSTEEPETPEDPTTEPKPEPTPDPESSTVETFEDDTFDVFEFDNWHDNQPNFVYGIVDGEPYGVASKVYGYRTISGYKPEVTMKFSSKADANYLLFESDMMFTTNGVFAPEFQFRTSDNNQLFVFRIRADGDKVYLLDSNSKQLATLANDGEWFKFGVAASASEGGSMITFYLDGEQIKTGTNYRIDASVDMVGRVRFWSETGHVGEIYLDNTTIVSEQKASEELPKYEFSEPEPEPKPEVSKVETYEDGDVLNLFSYNQWMNNDHDSVVTVDGKPYGSDSKVLLFSADVKGYFEIGFEQKSIPSGTKVYVYETDMMIAPTGTARVTGDLRGSDSGTPFTFVATENGAVTLNGITVANAGEWFKFTIECYEDESGKNMTKFYVNGNQVGDAASNSIATSTIQRTRIIVHNYICDVCFDNTKVEFRAE